MECGCALKCYTKLTDDQRKRVFSGFWALGDFNVQNAYLCGCVKILPVARHYQKASTSKRGNTRMYYVNNGRASIRVCKTAFLRIHGVSSGRLTRVLAGQLEQGGVPKMDGRGKHEPPNKTTEEDKEAVRQHIATFPTYESHYSRTDNHNRRYLSPYLTVTKMYQLYREQCTQNACRHVSEWVFRKIFKEEFNLSFGRYVTHTCSPPHTCTHALIHFVTNTHTHTHSLA